jgi:hypothetical protein
MNVEPECQQPKERTMKRSVEAVCSIRINGHSSAVFRRRLRSDHQSEWASNRTKHGQHDIADIKQGYIRLTNILAPAALGESRQTSNDKTAEV